MDMEYLQDFGGEFMDSPVDRVQQEKQARLGAIREAKYRPELRKDEKDYGNDSWLTQQAKGAWNSLVDHDNQMAVNVDGKRYNTENKIFNDETDLTSVWDSHEDNPAGDKVLYYLRKRDGYDEQGAQKYLYKTGIAATSAADRYKSQISNSDWDLLGEKRFDSASTVEKEIHGSQAARDARAFDYGQYTYDKQDKTKAYSDFGAGTSELYTSDILGLDTGTQEQYDYNKVTSINAMRENYANYTGSNDTFESADAFQSAVQQLVGKGIKLVGSAVNVGVEGDGAIEAYGKKLIADADSDWGYNNKTMMNASAGMKAALREGRPLDFVWNLVMAAPQAVAQSVPEMAMFMGKGGYLGAGVSALALMNANDTLDTREENNGGRVATWSERAAVMGAETIATGLDAGMFRFITMGPKGMLGIATKGEQKSWAKVIKETPPSFRKEMLVALVGRPIYKAGEATVGEAGQEMSTEAIRMLSESLGTTKFDGQDWLDVVSSEIGTDRLITSGVLGASGGLGFAAPSTAGRLHKDVQEARRHERNREILDDSVDGIVDSEDAAAKLLYAESDLGEIERMYNDTVSQIDEANSIETREDLLRSLARAKYSAQEMKDFEEAMETTPIEKLKEAHIAKLEINKTVLVEEAQTLNPVINKIKGKKFQEPEYVPTDAELDQEDIGNRKLSDSVDKYEVEKQDAGDTSRVAKRRERVQTELDEHKLAIEIAEEELVKATNSLKAVSQGKTNKKAKREAKKAKNRAGIVLTAVKEKHEPRIVKLEEFLGKFAKDGKEYREKVTGKKEASEAKLKVDKVNAASKVIADKVANLTDEKSKLVKENVYDNIDDTKYEANVQRIKQIDSEIVELGKPVEVSEEVVDAKLTPRDTTRLAEIRKIKETAQTVAEKEADQKELVKLNTKLSETNEYENRSIKRDIAKIEERLANTVEFTESMSEELVKLEKLEATTTDLELSNVAERVKRKGIGAQASIDKIGSSSTGKKSTDSTTKPKGFIDKILTKIDGKKSSKKDVIKTKEERVTKSIGRLTTKALTMLNSGDGIKNLAEKTGVSTQVIKDAIVARGKKIKTSDAYFKSGTKIVGVDRVNMASIQGAIASRVAEVEKLAEEGKLTRGEIVDHTNEIYEQLLQYMGSMGRPEFYRFAKAIQSEKGDAWNNRIINRLAALTKDKKKANEWVKSTTEYAISEVKLKEADYNKDSEKKKYVLSVARSKGTMYADEIKLARNLAEDVYTDETLDRVNKKLDGVEVNSDALVVETATRDAAEVQASSKAASDKILNDKNYSEEAKNNIKSMPASLRTYLFSEVGMSGKMLEDAGVYDIVISDGVVTLKREC